MRPRLAAERDVELSPTSTARLVREGPALPDPWPEGARQLFVRLLAAGRGLRAVWETLEETGALDRILPEWERIRLLPHASVIHRFTVDRHVVETCIEASALIRHVGRPDVLMVAALLHDIGKGELTEHSVAGEPIARAIATRMGFDERSVDLIGTAGALAPAARRDRDHPRPRRPGHRRAGSPSGSPDLEALNLLRALTESDARATAPKAWSTWRANLIDTVGRRRPRRWAGRQAARSSRRGPRSRCPRPCAGAPRASTSSLVEDGAQVTVIAPDRLGLLADVAALFATAAGVGPGGPGLEPGRRRRVGLGGRRGPPGRGRAAPAVRRDRRREARSGRAAAPSLGEGLAPTVVVRPEASSQSTVLEVRAADRTGVLYLACAALAA